VADPVRLRQALLNLLTNAVRFTEQGGITIRTARHEEGLLVTVQDTGPGIPVQDMPKLFKEFSQITPATDTSKGSGLGLAISKHLIELHGGHIWAESGGIGTTFHFTVPLIAQESRTANFVRVRSETSRAEGLASCLVIHRDPGMVRLVARYIDDYRIVGLPDETEVTSLVEQLHPRAIITVPELADRVLECLESTPCDVPLITCAMPGTIQQAHLDGVISYLIKPIMPEALVAVMRQVERNGETNVLLVDDDPDAVRLIERMLTCLPRPYRILKAYSGFQALDLMREQIPDVVLMDLVMPELDGRETIRRMRTDERLQDVPVMIISARDWIEHDSVLGTTLTIRYRHAIRITQGARCLHALLKALTPSYLSEAEGFLSSATVSPERSAFAALR
jgi:CheY-like chemotaxis protein